VTRKDGSTVPYAFVVTPTKVAGLLGRPEGCAEGKPHPSFTTHTAGGECVNALRGAGMSASSVAARLPLREA
jgi:hypothetical protein